MSVRVMHRPNVAGSGVHAFDPGIFREHVVEEEEHVLIFIARLKHVGMLDLHNKVGFAVSPFVFPRMRRRKIFQIAFWRACIDPLCQSRDFRIGETRIIDVASYLSGGVKRRHLALDYFFLDRASPRPCLFISHK